ncbi:hypothetical protein DFH11DRAFT_1574857 [Phellopilus nigrolimitatus]|nr:hypothetical protein DFH11DRAFT_1574857 [Phellopilus nigrolimitatus]
MFSFLDPSAASVSSNIQHYIAQASLPKLRLAPCTPRMPPENHKSHRNCLSIRPERYRGLRQMHSIKRAHIDRLTNEFIQKHIPSVALAVDDIDPETGERPCVPCEGYNIQDFGPLPLRHIDELRVSWLENLILRTVQRVLQMIPEYQSTKHFSFTCNDPMRDNDHKLFRYFMWERSSDAPGSSDGWDKPVKLIIAYQPPWILAPRDFEQFVATRSLPPFDERRGTDQEPYTSAQKVWGKLWDICKQNDCPSFVLTNYNQWVFGGFSARTWEYGFTSGIKHTHPTEPKETPTPQKSKVKRKAEPPVILEYLIYWIISSMNRPDRFTLPPVLEMVDLEMAVDDVVDAPQPQQVFGEPSFFTNYEPSESACSRSVVSDVPSSAGVRFDLESNSGNTHTPSLNENWQVAPASSLVVREKQQNIEHWLDKNKKIGFASSLPSIPRAPSPTHSEWSEASIATSKPHKCQGFFNMETTWEEVYEIEFK